MTLQFESLVFILIVLLGLSATNQVISLIDWKPININDPHVIDTAKFAVTEVNKRITIRKLTFEKVIFAESEGIIDGTAYRLTFSAHDFSVSHNYRAIVVDRPLEHFRNLTSFQLA